MEWPTTRNVWRSWGILAPLKGEADEIGREGFAVSCGVNSKTGAVSATLPVKRSNGLYYGDAQDKRILPEWRLAALAKHTRMAPL